MTDVSVVVVAYNGLPWIERCLESVRGHETIVVDHGSTDGTVELVKEKFPRPRWSSSPTSAWVQETTPGCESPPAATSCC